MRSIRRTALQLAFLLASSLFAFSQTDTGQISGTVADSTGAMLSGARVSAKAAGTGLIREATTNAAGIYNIPTLRPDSYEVTVEAPGFQKVTRNVQVAVGSRNDVSVQLAVSSTSVTVEVTGSGEAAEVNTENQTLSQTITAKQIELLPTSPTRNPYALVGISGNVAEDSSSTRGAFFNGSMYGYAINGQRSSSTDVLLDGAENVDAYTASVGQAIPLDSVQEFSVLTNNFTAEYGRASGGVINLVTKSGTNAFHGSAYEYNRVSALSANTYQNDATGQPKSGFTRNDFGFALGGPIIKDKLFFFNNAEWVRVRSSSNTDETILDPASIPTLAPAAQAFFSQFGKLSPGITTLQKGPCAAGSRLTCDEVSFVTPNDAGGGPPENTWEEVGKIDFNYSNKTTLSGRYASYNEIDFPGFFSNSPYAGYNTGQNQYDQNLEVSLFHVFSPTLVDTAKAVYNRLNGPNDPLAALPPGPTLYATSTAIPTVFGQPLVFPGYLNTAPGIGIPATGVQNVYQFYDDLSWTRGKHQFKFGGQYLNIKDNRLFGAYENPVEALGTNLNSALTNLTAGQLHQFQGAIFPEGEFPCKKDPATGNIVQTPACTLTLPVGEPNFLRNYRYNDFAFYAQDAWKIKPRLTLNLGVRWEYYGVQHNANTSLDSNFVLGTGSTFFDQIRNGQVQLAKNGGVFWNPNYKNFAPRLGFAWDMFGNGNTALRGGYAIGYERNFGNVTFNAIQNPPNYATLSLIAPTDVAFLPIFTTTAGPLAGTGSKAFLQPSQRAINQNIATAYAETYDLSLDHRVGQGVLSVTYAGSHGIHLYDISNINPTAGGGLYLGDTLNPTNRLNLQYTNINYRSDNGFSHYNSLNVKYAVNNLLNYGVGLTANYTWSHALDNLSSTFSDSNGGTQSGFYQLGYLDAFNPKLNFGNADFDIRHRFVLSGTWELPWMKNASNGFLRNALGGWGMGTVVNVRSGYPFSIYDCTNPTDTACPLWISPAAIPKTGNSVLVGPNTFNYIGLPANAAGVVANLGDSQGLPICSGLDHAGCKYTLSGLPYPDRNNYYGPGYWNTDMNFYKNFKLTERFGMQFRAEMYNIFNHHNQYVQTENLDVSSVATPFVQTEKGGIYGFAGQATDERRNIQFGLKLTF